MLLFSYSSTFFRYVKIFRAKSEKRKVESVQTLSAFGFHPSAPKSLGAYIGGVHLFPFRTEKLSPPEPMVLP